MGPSTLIKVREVSGMKIGIYGGTFNPPHLGHLAAAKTAIEVLGLDRLLLIPAAIPPHKVLPEGTPLPEHRLSMAEKMADALLRPKVVQVSTLELEREGTRFTGVLAANDTMALGAIKALKELTYAIPEDVEIIGFDNIGFSQLCDPPLATIQQPTIEMGRRAADTLIRAIVGKPIETKNIHLQPKLVVRGSVKTIYGERILYV